MKHSPIDRMNDPFYAQLMVHIEDIIRQADEAAQSIGLRLSDSQVKSALVKTRKRLRGGDPEVSNSSEKEQILARLVDSLCFAPTTLGETKIGNDGKKEEIPIEVSDWSKAIETVQRSLENRKSDIPGSRLYLDFVHRFLRDVTRK